MLPNSREIHVTITNAHWHLALAACFVAFANAPDNPVWRIFDLLVLLLVGLTGPWALVLTPLVLIFWWRRRQRWSLTAAALLGACAVVQAAELLTHSDLRPIAPLGATFSLFARLISGQIYAGAVWGQNSFDLRGHIVPVILVFSAGTAVLAYGLIKLRLEMKLFVTFAVLITAAALRSPLIVGTLPRWQQLAIDKGARYWFFPMLALVWSLLWFAAQRRPLALRLFSLLCFAAMLHAIPHDWRYWPYTDANFGRYLRVFQNAAPQTKVTIPIYPDGHQMILVKK